MDYSQLKARQRAERDNYPENLGLRVHRALSWLNRAEQCDDDDGRFIFLWIAFNAAYAHETGEKIAPDGRRVENFIFKLVSLDSSGLFSQLIWHQYSGPIRLLLANPFVFQPYWNFQNNLPGSNNWSAKFERAKKASNKALADQNTATVLTIVFSRLYTLRNQLIHGGATFAGQVNRQQVGDGAKFLGHVVPCVIKLMMDNPNADWGTACYPVQQDDYSVKCS